MDGGYTKAVLSAFVKLYEKGFIYKGHRLVNWCPVSKSAISHEEVNHQEVNGHLWHFKYPFKDSDEFVVVATTRPETMLGDTAVAVHPKDERYSHLVGKTVILPLVGRELPVIADNHVDPEFGTGCVKVTPAHDPNDFSMSERHGLELVNIMNEDASINENAPDAYQNLSRDDARKAVVKDLEEQGFLVKTEDYVHKVGYSERGQVPIEFYMSEQWFIKMGELVKPALKAVAEGKIKFHPEYWVKTYKHWMENIKDWCISRQLWWGHQIPVWYHKEDPQKMHVSIEEPDDPKNWYREPDVLDTWASSWLWPLAVHDWPEESADLDYFYPTDVLVTGPDIIFFWVARMIIAGYEFKSDLPFKDVYFTSILRDETGRKFSKSLGNSPDPFELFNEYGTDAVRFGTMLMSPQGLDVLFSSNRLEVGRNFMNKLWNASRFVLMNMKDGQTLDINFEKEKLDLPEQWILSKTQKSIQAYNRQLERFHFNEAAKVLYDFTWNDFCDWYIEISKIHLREKDSQKGDVVRGVIVHVLKTILSLLHPYAPFITEELWSQFKAEKDLELIVSPWPDYHPELVDSKAEKTMGFLQDIIISVRTIRGQMNVPPGKKADMVVRMHGDSKLVLEKYGDVIKSLCGIREISVGEFLDKPPHSAVAVIRDMEIFLPLEGLIDIALEQERLEKREADLKIYISNIQKKLSKRDFLSRAPKKVVEREGKKLIEMNNELKMLTINLEMLQ